MPEQMPKLGRYTPYVFNKTTRGRFFRDRERRYLAKITGAPTDRQVGQIEAMTRLEWQALKAAAEGNLQGDRESREFTRLLDRMAADFERSLAQAPNPLVPTLAEHIATKYGNRGAAA